MPEHVKVKINNQEINDIVKLVAEPVSLSERHLCGLLHTVDLQITDLEGYAYVLTENRKLFESIKGPAILVDNFQDLNIRAGDVIQINAKHQHIQFLYKTDGNANCLYMTDCCNSHCLMCPQPPKNINSVELPQLQRIIHCLPNNLKEICVTGGEPTLLGQDLIYLLQQLAQQCPECHVHMLTNGREFKDIKYAKQCLNTGLKGISFGIPLYSSIPEIHDYIVQSHNSFHETLEGIYNLAKLNASIEIRIVLTKINALHLKELADFIYRNLTFVDHVALMGMEHMGYVKLNWDKVYIDPREYQESLVSAARFLRLRGMHVSIYNLPLCILNKKLWIFARHSISDFKQGYSDQCSTCDMLDKCGGLFQRQINAMHVAPIKIYS